MELRSAQIEKSSQTTRRHKSLRVSFASDSYALQVLIPEKTALAEREPAIFPIEQFPPNVFS